MEGSEYLQRLLRQCAAEPAVAAAAVGGAGTMELDLYLRAPRGLPIPLDDWLLPLGEVAYAADGEVITTDGLIIRIWLNRSVPAGAQALFDRGTAPPVPQPEETPTDLARAAAQFWRDLYQACGAIGRSEPLTAHGRLERCRTGLLGIYRLALRPARPGEGWEGIEQLPGAAKTLEALLEWLVQPLDLRAQWRCAYRLAESYEKLMLPLSERLQIEYPWAMRSLAFRRLDEIRPDRTAEAPPAVPKLREVAEAEAAPRKAGPMRFKRKPAQPSP